MTTKTEPTPISEAQKLEYAMRAKVGMIWIRSPEEVRIERTITEICASFETGKQYTVWKWTVTGGLREIGTESDTGPSETRDLSKALQRFVDEPGRACAIFHDMGPWLDTPLNARKARDIHRLLKTIKTDNAKQIIVVDLNAPPASFVGPTVIDWPLPQREVMAFVLDHFAKATNGEALKNLKMGDNRERVISAMVGMTSEDAANALSRSLAAHGRFDAKTIAAEKERIVKNSGLEWYEPDPRGFAGVGGMDALKSWLLQRRNAFSSEAREYGLPMPKGAMILGCPGTGKSLTAKCIASEWNLPLIRIDMGALFSKFVGESEQKSRAALATIDAIGASVVWIDEIEKAVSGMSGGEQDGGTAARVFGTFLTWMQEHKSAAFIVATANDVSKLPPEFLRAGRWDDIWFVDLPNEEERRAIVEVMKNKYPHTADVNVKKIAATTANHTGAEIEQAFVESLYKAFNDGAREVSTVDVLESVGARIPLAETMREKIEDLRKFAKSRARLATSVTKKTEAGIVESREID